jgi:hypothetical protein
MTEHTRELLGCTAALLDQGRIVDRLSRPLTASALVAILISPALSTKPPLMVVGFAMLVAVAGLAETYLAIRVSFDGALLHQVANAPDGPDFARTDASLMRLGLIPPTKSGRPAMARVAGAKRLLVFQIAALVVQVTSVFVGASIALA